MSFKSNAFLLSVVATSLLAGCASPPPVVAPINPDAEVMAKIAASADRASLSMQRLAALRGSAQGMKLVEAQTPPGLDVLIKDLSWSGPIAGLVKKVADLSGYAYADAQGMMPSSTVNVSIAVSSATAFNILSDAGAQAGSAADIVIQPDAKRIFLKYPPVVRSGGYAFVKSE